MGLQDRAARAAGQPGTDLDRQPTGAQLGDRIQRLEAEFAKAMSSGQAGQLVRDAITCLRTTKNLDRCEPNSVLGGLMTCAQLSLRPGVLGHAWLVPFWDGQAKGYKAQLIIGYEGYLHLGYESDRVADFSGRRVHEADVYEAEYGLQPSLVHRPAKGDRGPVVGYYSTFRTTTGGSGFYDMTHAEVLAWRDQYAPRGKPRAPGELGPFVGPWRSPEGSADFIGMGIKTTVRQLAKWMPRSPQLATAAAVDGSVRIDVSALSEAEAVSSYPAGEDGEPLTGQVFDPPRGEPCEHCTGTTTAHSDDACPGIRS